MPATGPTKHAHMIVPIPTAPPSRNPDKINKISVIINTIICAEKIYERLFFNKRDTR